MSIGPAAVPPLKIEAIFIGNDDGIPETDGHCLVLFLNLDLQELPVLSK